MAQATRREWTEEEQHILREGIAARATWHEIARSIDRTADAVYNKAVQMGWFTPKPRKVARPNAGRFNRLFGD